jgi:hypothetical protein
MPSSKAAYAGCVRSNIQAGTSSQRSEAKPVSVQRKATPSDFAIGS